MSGGGGRGWRWAVAAVVVGAAAVTSGVAQAGDQVAEWLEGARRARAEGRFADALELLVRAHTAHPEPALLFNIGKVYQDQGDCENALRYMLRARTDELADEEPSERLLGAVRGEVEVFSCPAGPEAAAKVLEQNLERYPAAIHLRLASLAREAHRCDEARSHLEAASAAGEAVITAVAEEELTSFRCGPAETAASSVEEVERPHPRTSELFQWLEDDDLSTEWTVTWTLLGVGGAMLLTGAVYHVTLALELSDLERYQTGDDASRFIKTKREALISQTRARVFYGLGLLTAGGGAVWYYLLDQQSQGQAWRWAPLLDADVVGVGVELELP